MGTVSFWGYKSVLKLTVMLVAQIFVYIKSHELYFEVANYMVCELYPNNVVVICRKLKVK